MGGALSIGPPLASLPPAKANALAPRMPFRIFNEWIAGGCAMKARFGLGASSCRMPPEVQALVEEIRLPSREG